MAINVNTVYQTVLLILNNEQRGYMTPNEFNKISTQVQREIFERYFEDLNQQVRVPQTDMDYANRVANIDEKIAEFKTENNQNIPEKTIAGSNPFTVPSELYRLGSFTYEPALGTPVEIQRLTRGDYYNINKSPLTTPTTTFPIYLYEDNNAIVYPSTITGVKEVKMQYVKKPSDVRWGYSIGSLGQYIYDPTIYGANLLNNGGVLTNFTTALAGGIIGSYTPTFVTSNATPGTFAISATVTSATEVTITITDPGSNFVVGDTITINAGQLGATSTGPVIQLTAADFNANSTYGSTNFELHNSEQTEVILNVLLYAGIVIGDPKVVQVAAQQVQRDEVNEKT